MKRTILWLLAAGCLGFSACSMMNDEDKECYGRGWLHPKDLDDPSWNEKEHGAPTHGPTSEAPPAAPDPDSYW